LAFCFSVQPFSDCDLERFLMYKHKTQLHCAVFLTGIHQKTRRFWNYTVALWTVFFILLMYLIYILEIHLLDLAGMSQFSCFTATVRGSGVILHCIWRSNWVSCPLYHANYFFTFHPHLNVSQVNTVTYKTVLCASLRTTSYQVVEAGIVCSWFGILLQSDSCVPTCLHQIWGSVTKWQIHTKLHAKIFSGCMWLAGMH
jgi:hypothetical protein